MTDSRLPLERSRIVETARELADANGIAKVTMRSLADALSVTPMSLYRYIANKDELLDALVDSVFAEIEIPKEGGEWSVEMRSYANSARRALVRHPWSISLIETRTNPGVATLTNRNAVLGTLRSGGFSIPLAALAFSTIDAYVFGFVLEETTLPLDDGNPAEVAQSMMEAMPSDQFPYLTELAVELVMVDGYDFGAQFDDGLDLILEGLANRLGISPDR